ncbi:MAG: hypothetical protein ACTFAK_14385 [Candidatus Electronema sp. VV]
MSPALKSGGASNAIFRIERKIKEIDSKIQRKIDGDASLKKQRERPRPRCQDHSWPALFLQRKTLRQHLSDSSVAENRESRKCTMISSEKPSIWSRSSGRNGASVQSAPCRERKTAHGHHLRHDAQSFVHVAVGILIKSGKIFDPAFHGV